MQSKVTVLPKAMVRIPGMPSVSLTLRYGITRKSITNRRAAVQALRKRRCAFSHVTRLLRSARRQPTMSVSAELLVTMARSGLGTAR